MSVKGWFRQLGNNTKRFFGRQLPQGLNKWGRQANQAFKLMPQAFKDTAKVYSDLEKKTKGIPVIHDLFSLSAKGTQAIGDGLSGNFSKAYAGGKATIDAGKGGLEQIDKLAPLFL